ncbi:MAG: S8 family serine peptidase [Promethearchaeota archaeon]
MNMYPDIIYPLFLKKIRQSTPQILKALIDEVTPQEDIFYDVLVSFESKENRDLFIKNNTQLIILKKFNIIPSINISLSKQQIFEISKNPQIARIEENQNLYLSMLRVIKMIQLEKYRKSAIPFMGSNVIIGLIDNGINRNFDSIYDIIVNNYFFNNNRPKRKIEEITHATIMANIIGNQYLDLKENILGIAPKSRIIDFNISNKEEKYTISSVLEVFDYILEKKMKLDIILLPLTSLEPSDGEDVLSRACNLMSEKGYIIICPAGNFGAETSTIGTPAAAKNVITIGASTKEGNVAYFSGRGPTLDGRSKPDICFPGSKITIPLTNEIRIEFSGTSISAAIGTGIIALLKESNPNLNHINIKNIFTQVRRELNATSFTQGNWTADLIDIFRAAALYEELSLPYNYLLKRAIKFGLEFLALSIGIFYLFYYLRTTYFLI